MKKYIVGNIITENKILKNHLIIFNNKVLNIEKYDETKKYNFDIEFFDGFISPGFIDIHIHGSGGSDTMDGTTQALDIITKNVVKAGTTSILATTMTMKEENIINALENVRNYIKKNNNNGANILGVHLEGPFINEEYKGAQDGKYIQKPNDKWVKDYYDIIKIITLAPEKDKNYEMIKEFSLNGVVVSLGHSAASYETAKEAYYAGAKHITHCYNAMTSLHHRKPGLVGASLILPFSIEMITDTIHIHKDLIGPTIKWKGQDKVILITDAMRAAFLPEGISDLGGQKVKVKDGKCTLEDGTIAGSVHTQDNALRNMIEHTDFDILSIIRMMSINPAKLLNIEKIKGSIEIGKDSDIVLIDNDYRINKTYVKGKKVYESDNS